MVSISERALGQPLGALSAFCIENGLPLLSTLVVYQHSYTPGSGYFKYFFPDASQNEWGKINKEQLKHITDYPNWRSVAEKFHI